ncbi:efflux RND transporter periplasmic adaptor subunit [Hymenobacter sp. RP-2-7]|uniref:Efflux RND transporter periplasmic adaptor subunit n=1 Tax=Hymenobacter polaris TaxID=2682546 RepID=A0A7Y0AE53_9BACT|nr:efflux RND transporter periplasmic adaptor subunit [Hymenobacter polaris]
MLRPRPRLASPALSLLLASALGLGLAACTAKAEKDNSKAEAPPTLPVLTLTTSEQELFHDYVADIQAIRNVEVRAQVPGFLEKILVDEGKPVKKGQPMFQLNTELFRHDLLQAQAAVASAEAKATEARVERGRVQLLVSKNVIAKSELTLAESKVRDADAHVADARASVADARTQLSYTLIRAPFDGITDRIPLKMGSVVDKGTLLTTVSDLHQVYAYFDIGEGEYLALRRARELHPELHPDSVDLTMADGSRYPLAGRIETSESQIDPSTGSLAIRARFANPDRLLKHGSTGKVRLTTTLPKALMVPQRAAFELQDKNYVYVVDQSGTVHSRSFKPQTRIGPFYVVKDGLKPGERVVYEGTQELRDGQRIQPKTVQMDSLLADGE